MTARQCATGRRISRRIDALRAVPRHFVASSLVKLKGRSEELVVSRNYVDLFRQM